MIDHLFESDSFKYKKYVAIKGTKIIKIVKEVEEYDTDYVLYRTDGTSYGINQCISIDDNLIEYRRRNWYLISTDTENLHFQNITGITVDKHIFGSTIKIKSTGSDPILIPGFWKKKSNAIKQICANNISSNTQKGTNEVLADAMSKAIGNAQSMSDVSIISKLRNLKELLDQGVLSQEEFKQLKTKIINE